MAELYELVLNQTYFAQECVNRWNYVMEGTPSGVTGAYGLVFSAGAILEGDPPDLPTGGMMAILQALQDSQVVFVQISARNVYDPTDFYTYAWTTPITGAVSGGGVSPSVAWGFRTNRVRADVRRGQKRFVGVALSDSANGGLFTGGAITRQNNMATAMTVPVYYTEGGNSLTYAPAVCKREKYTTPAGNPAYRYYASESAQLAQTVTGIIWERLPNTRTQGSRQYGRGE